MKKLLTLLLITYSSFTLAIPDDIKIETESIIKSFQTGDFKTQKSIAQRLEWLGISDIRLFDAIEKKVLAEYAQYDDNENNDRHGIDYISWLAKALAFSGQKKYTPTLSEVSNNSSSTKIVKYADISIKLLPKYTHWNNIIVNKDNWNSELSKDINRFSSMLTSNEPHLILLASKRIHYQRLHDPRLLNILEKEILSRYKNERSISEDTLTWMTKALAGSGNTNYRKTIDIVSEDAESSYVRESAYSYLRYF